jgi:hypothetical protein
VRDELCVSFVGVVLMEYEELDGPFIGCARCRDVEDAAEETCEGRLAGRAWAGETNDQGTVLCSMVVGHCPRLWAGRET